MRPHDFEGFVGQDKLLGKEAPLRRLIESDTLTSMILFGPPGSGKTTLASLVEQSTSARFVRLNAVLAGVADLRRVFEEADRLRKASGRRTVLFVDEIHRFNKGQQDALLPAVEEGRVILLGTTTENPFFVLSSPLVSRCRLFRFELLSRSDLQVLMERALHDTERGLGGLGLQADEEALAFIAGEAAGDARIALGTLELAAQLCLDGSGAEPAEVSRLTISHAMAALQERAFRYDRDGDAHYDAASALIKSMRGGDPDAALYWLARMIKGGEDPRFLARRIVIAAAEDVGNADPQALVVATAAAHAVELLGMPEARIPLAQAAVYLACAPKSNAVYRGIDKALSAAGTGPGEEVPAHLRDTSYRGAARLGHGEGYLYPHDFEGGWVKQVYLPPGAAGSTFYAPSDRGFEAEIRRRLAARAKTHSRTDTHTDTHADTGTDTCTAAGTSADAGAREEKGGGSP
ncbi:MAG: replication-associated recombination protein A [Firmicutes bacterium]|nr:replication-associated recombination protein A [Bacillota bacterium]